ncbi:hypothetical protein Tco_0667101, partial [Tanacetum coccineum]
LKMRDSIERDKTLADLGPWEDQISLHEGEIKFASFVMEVVYSSPNFDINGVVLIPSLSACEDWLTADIQSKNLSTMDMQAKGEPEDIVNASISMVVEDDCKYFKRPRAASYNSYYSTTTPHSDLHYGSESIQTGDAVAGPHSRTETYKSTRLSICYLPSRIDSDH